MTILKGQNLTKALTDLQYVKKRFKPFHQLKNHEFENVEFLFRSRCKNYVVAVLT